MKKPNTLSAFYSLLFRFYGNAIIASLLLLYIGFLSAMNVEADPPQIDLEEVISGLSLPVAITHSGDNSGRLFITLQEGEIVVYDGTQVLPAPFLNISLLVSCCGERGLFSVAFHPNYEINGFLYVNYTDNDGNTVVERYSVSNDPNVADPATAHSVIKISQPAGNHNGGQVMFGPDGYFYIGMGDGGGAGDAANNAQNTQSLLGKMLRIDVDNDDFPQDDTKNYSVPPSNPFVGNANVLDEIWSSGLRNPWRFSFDRNTSDIFIGDVGQNSVEEIDFQPVTSGGGENYGWRCYEGNSPYNTIGCAPASSYVFPIAEYSHSLGCSVTGGYVYRGSQATDLSGYYLYGDFCSGRIWGAIQDNGNWTSEILMDSNLTISTFGEDEDGELYVAHHAGSGNGAIYRIIGVINPPTFVDKVASSQSLISGNIISESLSNTFTNDDLSEALREQTSGGKPSGRKSFIDKEFSFDSTGGNVVTFFVNAFYLTNAFDEIDDGESFIFQFFDESTSSWANMVEILPSDNIDDDIYHTFSGLPTDPGSITVRVVSSNQNDKGNNGADEIAIDHLFIRCDDEGTPPPPPPPPPPPAGITLSTDGFKFKGQQRVNLNWSPSGTLVSVTVIRTNISGNGSSAVFDTENDGSHLDEMTTKGGSVYDYQVCEAGTSNCSNISRVVF